MPTNYGQILNTGVDIIAAPVDRSQGTSPAALALKGIADGLTLFSQDRKQRAARKRQEANDARLEAEAARKATDRGAAGDAIYRAVLINAGTDKTLQPSERQDPFGESVTDFEKIFGIGRTEDTLTEEEKALRKDSDFAAKRIKEYDNAISQGTLPGLSKDAAVDMVFQELINKWGKEAAPVILKSMKDAGLEGGLLNELKRDTEIRERTEGVEDKAFEQAYAIGSSNLDAEEISNMSPEQIVSFGLQIQKADENLERIQKQASLAKTQGDIQESQYDFNERIAGKEARQASNEVIQANLAPLIESFVKLQQLAGEAGGDVGLEERLANSYNLMKQKAATIVNNQIARLNIQDPDAARQVREDMENYTSSLLEPFEQRNESYSNALKAFENRLGLNAATSLPVISQLNAAGLRVDAIPALMQVVSEDADLQERLKFEIANLGNLQEDGGFNTNSAKIQISEIISLMNGNETLENFSNDKAKSYVNKLYKVGRQMAPAIAKGNFDTADEYLNSMGVVVTATNSLNVSSGTNPNLSAAYAISGSPQARRAVERLMQNPDTSDEARVLGVGMRAAATKLAINLRTIAESKSERGWVVGFANGQYGYRFEGNERVVTPFGIVDQSQGNPQVPKSIKGFVKIANDNINFLAETNDWEKDSIKGTNKELREFYGQGKMTSAMRKEQQKERKERATNKSDRLKAFDTFDEEVLQEGSFDLDAPSTVGKIIQAESGGKANAKNPNSSATGAGQFIESTWLDQMEKNRPDLTEGKSRQEILALRKDPELSAEMTAAYARENQQVLQQNNIVVNDTTTYLAHFLGVNSAVKALKTRNPITPLERVLPKATIKANSFLRGKTIQWLYDWAQDKMRG